MRTPLTARPGEDHLSIARQQATNTTIQKDLTDAHYRHIQAVTTAKATGGTPPPVMAFANSNVAATCKRINDHLDAVLRDQTATIPAETLRTLRGLAKDLQVIAAAHQRSAERAYKPYEGRNAA